ncbi:MAG: zinc ribbon domain-containing protein [Nitrospirae bacterium]|nr:zinc ribbon domain-containing protein [Nitrospirota bacterium]
MPIYEYECRQCSKHLEVTQKITDPPLTDCSSCGGELRKIITNTSFVLKGSGWYVTDYPSADRKNAIDSGKPADAQKTEKPAETKTTEAAKA